MTILSHAMCSFYCALGPVPDMRVTEVKRAQRISQLRGKKARDKPQESQGSVRLLRWKQLRAVVVSQRKGGDRQESP